MRRAVVRAAVVLAAATTSLPVLADDAPAKVLTPTALWGSLPTSRLSHIPPSRSAPSALSPGERAEGVWLVRPKWMQSNRDYRATALVVGSDLLAREVVSGQSTSHDNDVCLTTSAMPAVVDDPDLPKDWPSDMPSQATISWQPPQRGDNAWSIVHRPLRVTAIHFERLVRTDEGATSIEYRDAWVDPVSLGSRLIGTGVLPLARVASGPAGLAVYVARDEDVVHFVVEPGASPSDEPALRGAARNLSAQFNFGHSDCGFLRATFPATDGAEMATFFTTAITGFTQPPPRTDGQTARPRTARRRTLLVFASATRSSVDHEPVLSVAFGWGGREDEFQF